MFSGILYIILKLVQPFLCPGSTKRGRNRIFHNIKLVKVNGAVLSIDESRSTEHLAIGSDQGYVSFFFFFFLFLYFSSKIQNRSSILPCWFWNAYPSVIYVVNFYLQTIVFPLVSLCWYLSKAVSNIWGWEPNWVWLLSPRCWSVWPGWCWPLLWNCYIFYKLFIQVFMVIAPNWSISSLLFSCRFHWLI